MFGWFYNTLQLNHLVPYQLMWTSIITRIESEMNFSDSQPVETQFTVENMDIIKRKKNMQDN